MNILEVVRSAARVYVIGNGGSFANASHVANDLLSRGIKAFTIDPAFFSATANDFGYERSFSRWISIVGEPGDVLIAMSGSGKSPNILEAATTAEMKGMKVVRLYGNEAGLDMQKAEEAQLTIGHSLMREL